MTVLLENEALRAQAGATTSTQFAESPDLRPDLKEQFLGTTADDQGAHDKLVDLLSESSEVGVVIEAFARAHHHTGHALRSRAD